MKYALTIKRFIKVLMTVFKTMSYKFTYVIKEMHRNTELKYTNISTCLPLSDKVWGG